MEQGTLNGLFILLLLLEIVYFAFSWDHIYNITQISSANRTKNEIIALTVAFFRIPVALLAAALLALMRCDPVGKEEQVRVFSSARLRATTWVACVTCAAEAYALRPLRPSS